MMLDHGQVDDGDAALRILFVDDDPILREFAKVYLAPLSTEVETAADGACALTLLATRAFDMVLTDVEMPALDGIQLTAAIRQDPRIAHLPVVMVTGHDDVISIDRAYEAGATSFVSKPVNWHQLIHQLRFVLRTSALETELRAAREAAESASRVKGNIIRAVQHELRTPLNAVVGYAQLLKERLTGSDQRLAGYAVEVERGGLRLVGLFDNMMATARLAAGDAAPQEDEWDLARILAKAMEHVEVLVDRPGTVVMDPQLMKIRIGCDRDLMALLFQHLIANAMTHGAGGVCTVRAVSSGDGATAVEVVDEGRGFVPKDGGSAGDGLEDGIADDFLHRDGGGLGLGLATVRLIAALHGGEVQYRSEPGSGTIARLVLPAGRFLRQSDAAAA